MQNIRRSNKYTNMRISWDKKTIVYFQKTKNFTSFSSTVRARYNQIVICNKIRIKINTLSFYVFIIILRTIYKI